MNQGALSKIFLICLLSSLSFHANAQESLSLSSAITNALKNNFFINISKNDDQVVKNNNTLGNAGFLPEIGVAANINKSSLNTRQKYSSGSEVNQKNATTDNFNAGARLTWTLFDGMKMFATKSKLNQSAEASDLYLKIQIENTVADVIKAYFDIVRIDMQIKVLEENIKIDDDRLQIAETRFKIGSASKLDFLQAKVDRNEKYSEILALRENYNTSLAELNRLMGITDPTSFALSDSMVIAYHPSYNDLKQSVLKSNKEIFLDMKNTEISKSVVKEIQSNRFPKLDFNLNYNYSRIKNEVGFSLLNQNEGASGGFTLSWNIFNGFNTNREIANAKLNLKTTELILADTRSKINHDLFVAFKKFESDLELLHLEESNMEFANENVTVSLEAYRLGSISGLQLKEAQNSYQSALSRLVNARFQAKISETELMRLNGELVK